MCLILIMIMLSTGPEGSPKQTCGIPIRNWLNVFFSAFGFRSFLQIIKLYIINHCYRYQFQFDMARLIIIDGFLIGWLVYGNHIFYSPANNCNMFKGTEFLYQFMSCILFVGYLLMAIYSVLVVMIPFMICYALRYNR